MGIKLFEKPVEDTHLKEIAQKDSIITLHEDSLKFSQVIIDSLNKELESKSQQAEVLITSLDKTEKELKKVKGSLKSLTNNQLVTEANKMYGGSDTTKLEILLSRPTTEFLIEEAKKIDILISSLEFSKSLNKNYREQILLQTEVIDQHVSDKENLRAIIELREDQLSIKTEAYDRLNKKYNRQKLAKKLIIGVAGGLLIYSAVK